LTATEASPRRSAPVGALVLLALAGILYIWLMVNITGPSGSGEASIGQAIEALFATVLLWVVLALLLVVGGVIGEMPRSAAILAGFVHPLSAIGAVVAIDMVSRHAVWAILVPGLLPLLLAFYAMWARLPALRAVFPPGITSIAVWGAILVLSIAPLPIAYWGPGTFGR
jgi:hypothetical protein